MKSLRGILRKSFCNTGIAGCIIASALFMVEANHGVAAEAVGQESANQPAQDSTPVQQTPEAVAPASNIAVEHLTADEKASADGDTLPEYEYVAVSRPDPFKPFIAIKSVAPTDADDDMNLSGMQLFEPNQLTLVAVMDTPRGRMAMVEDVTKKGYKIVEGEKIGRRGVVTEIQKEQLLVTETHTNNVGEEIKTVISMKLKRDGEGK